MLELLKDIVKSFENGKWLWVHDKFHSERNFLKYGFFPTIDFTEFLVFKKSELLTKSEICRTPECNRTLKIRFKIRILTK